MALKAGYKQTEVGVIPEDWDVKSIQDFSKIQTGPFGTLLAASEYSEYEGVPLISVGEIGAGRFKVTDHTPRIPANVIRRLPQYVLRFGDIVFGRKGAVDRSAIVTENEDGWFLGSDGISIRPSNKCHPPYLAAQFQRHEVQSWLLHNAVGTTMASLNQGILGNTQIPYPSRPEQQAIAEVLSDADALIESLEQLLIKKRQIKKGAMRELLTGERRLLGFSGEWEVVRLGDLAAFYKGKGLPKSSLSSGGAEKCIHYGELFTQYPEIVYEIISRTDAAKDTFISAANDVLMPTSDVTPKGLAKASCILFDGVILGGDILVIRSNKLRLHGAFLSHVIRQQENQVLQLVTGTTVFHLYASDMKRFTFSLPTVEEQIAIASMLSMLTNEITALETQLQKARLIKQGMMQELLTGRIRLV